MAAAWSDSPITTKDDDDFNRADYAVHAAHLVAASHSWDDSIVFGLTGPWGSGKSSMLAMIGEELQRSHPDWRIARFTPLGDKRYWWTLRRFLRIARRSSTKEEEGRKGA